jgi:hypothetical protein
VELQEKAHQRPALWRFGQPIRSLGSKPSRSLFGTQAGCGATDRRQDGLSRKRMKARLVNGFSAHFPSAVSATLSNSVLSTGEAPVSNSITVGHVPKRL